MLSESTPYPFIRSNQKHLRELTMLINHKEVRRSKYFVMTRHVQGRKRGRGAKFQNVRAAIYKITPAMSVFSSAWSPRDEDVSELVNADFIEKADIQRPSWGFRDQRAADRAWILLGLKWQ